MTALLRALIHASADAMFAKDARCGLFPPETAKAIEDHDRSALAAGAPGTYEEVIALHGELRTFITTKAPYREESDGRVLGVIGIARDVTVERRREEALQRSERYHRALIDHAWDMIIVIDLAGKRPEPAAAGAPQPTGGS